MRWYILFCRECDPDLEAEIPFTSAAERGKWAGAHTRETGHGKWLVFDIDREEPKE